MRIPCSLSVVASVLPFSLLGNARTPEWLGGCEHELNLYGACITTGRTMRDAIALEE